MDLWRLLSGMVEVELTSADPAGALRAINEAGITVYKAQQQGDLTLRFFLQRRDHRKLRLMAEKRGERLAYAGRRGGYWAVKQLFRRPVLMAGAFLILLLTIFLPTRIYFVEVEGNVSIPTNLIVEKAENCGIGFGSSRREVRSERMKNALLQAVPELKWAGVNTRGCVAVISVREGAKQVEVPKDSISSVVADRDGMVVSCTATRGNLLVKEGQVVKQGQVLISAYTDCGLSIQATRAEGEVFAQTVRTIRSVKPVDYCFRVEGGESVQRFGILIGKKRINLWKDSGIWDATCGRMYQEYYLILPGGFRIPLAAYVETVTPYVTAVSGISPEAAEDSLANDAQLYLLQNMVAGTVQSRRTQTVHMDGLAVFEGTFLCTEMIGRMQTEQIGEEHGKTN